ncbi:MAG: hypothetical protein IJM57_08575 [Lachnospiraceae bacterium]|nr:hypothetical protein [Lachnospiraceae bacterium]
MLVTVINIVLALVLWIADSALRGVSFVNVGITGALLIAMTAESLVTEESGKTRTVLRTALFALTAGFAVLGHGWWSFTVFACLTVPSIPITALIAAAGYALKAILSARPVDARFTAETLVCAALVAAIVALIRLGKKALAAVKRREEIAKERLLRASVSEMNERRINRELSQQSYAAERNARLLERENISRSIHNNVGHTITAAIMTLDAADMLFDAKPEEARKRMNDANDRIRGSLESIRSAVRALDEEGGELPIIDLKRYLQNAIEDFTMDTERTVSFASDCYADDITVPREHVEFLTGVLQEAFSNGVKHGGAKTFAVSLSADSAHVKLSVKDDGVSDFGEAVSAERIAAGFGLRKITAYAERCGGTAAFDNEAGFRTEVELPLQRR